MVGVTSLSPFFKGFNIFDSGKNAQAQVFGAVYTIRTLFFVDRSDSAFGTPAKPYSETPPSLLPEQDRDSVPRQRAGFGREIWNVWLSLVSGAQAKGHFF